MAADGIGDVAARLSDRPRAVWSMVPSGTATEQVLHDLAVALAPGDIVVDGGNSYYKESVRRGGLLRDRGIHFIDSGTSWHLGSRERILPHGRGRRGVLPPARTRLRHARASGRLSARRRRRRRSLREDDPQRDRVRAHGGVRRGIRDPLRLGVCSTSRASRPWRNGSVVRSWLLDLAADALRDDPKLERVKDYVDDSGEGRWTVIESVERAIPAPVLTLALQARFRCASPRRSRASSSPRCGTSSAATPSRRRDARRRRARCGRAEPAARGERHAPRRGAVHVRGLRSERRPHAPEAPPRPARAPPRPPARSAHRRSRIRATRHGRRRVPA